MVGYLSMIMVNLHLYGINKQTILLINKKHVKNESDTLQMYINYLNVSSKILLIRTTMILYNKEEIMNNRDKLVEATVNALRNEEYLDKNIEDQLDNVYKGLIREIKKAFPDCKIEDKDLSDQGYKHETTITTPSIMIKENVYRYILIDIFYNIPSFPIYDYYLGASAEVVESSSNETSVAGLKSNGYKIKNEIPNCKISIKAYAGEDITDKGQSIDEFISNVLKAYNSLETYNIKRFMEQDMKTESKNKNSILLYPDYDYVDRMDPVDITNEKGILFGWFDDEEIMCYSTGFNTINDLEKAVKNKQYMIEEFIDDEDWEELSGDECWEYIINTIEDSYVDNDSYWSMFLIDANNNYKILYCGSEEPEVKYV